MGTDSVIYIRTDGNSKIATGHLVRCLCIAQALETLEKKVCFLVSDEESFSLLHDLAGSIFQGYSFSFEAKILKSAVYNDLELELEELISTFQFNHNNSEHLLDNFHPLDKQLLPDSDRNLSEYFSHNKTILFIDSYFVTERYLTTLSPYAKIAYMDDIRAFDYPVDLLINYDVIPPSKETSYTESYQNAKKTLLGALFTPLRKQFQNQTIIAKDNIQSILITSGGSDPYHFTEMVADYLLKKNPNLALHIVVGRLFSNKEVLETFASLHPLVHLHHNVSDMASLMKQCDFAISAAGTTLYELCALGIPAISFSMADNQVPMAETFDEVGAVPYAGDIRRLEDNKTEKLLDNIYKHIISLHHNPDDYVKQQKNMHSLVDGNGAIKIAEELCKL